MRPTNVIVPILVVGALGVGAYLCLQSEAEPTTQTRTTSIPDAAQPATVNYVHDGDTLFLDTPLDANLKVRLLGIDTPEVGENAECFGDEATAQLRTLAPEGSTVYTLPDEEPLDKYGRSLLYLFTPDGELINLTLVADGFAEAVVLGANDAYAPELFAAEDAARDARLGFWGSC